MNSKQNMEIWKPVVGYEGLYEVSNLAELKAYLNIITNILKYYHFNLTGKTVA